MDERLRLYHVEDASGEIRACVVAHTVKDAKQMIWNHDFVHDVDWIDLRVSWNKNADIEGFGRGVIDTEEDCLKAIKKGIFHYQGDGCEYCGYNEECSKHLNRPIEERKGD